jgi:predicted metallopeptidase
MGIYHGYSLFRKHRGRIIFRKFSRFKGKTIYGALCRIEDDYVVEINSHVSWNQRLKTYVHELLHLGLEYDGLDRNWFSRCPKKGLEEDIEKLVDIIIEMQPKLVRHLRFDLERIYLSKRH